jgi:hypothetical protein
MPLPLRPCPWLLLLLLLCSCLLIAPRARADSSETASYSIHSDSLAEDADSSSSSLLQSSINATAATTPIECGIYMAPSTIPGAGLGIFAGRAFRAHEPLQQSGDLALSIVDIVLHNNDSGFTFLWDEYTWNAEALNVSRCGWK